jgi:hypothetical protein
LTVTIFRINVVDLEKLVAVTWLNPRAYFQLSSKFEGKSAYVIGISNFRIPKIP